MVDTVVTLATNYGHERPDNDIGTLTREEATRAVLKNQGNIWNSVTECVEERRRKVASRQFDLNEKSFHVSNLHAV